MYTNIRNIVRLGAAGVATSAVVTTLAGAGFAGHTSEGYPGEPPLSRQCFMEQPDWNDALDGPVPLCPGPSTTSAPSQPRRHSSDGQSDGYGPIEFTATL